MLSISREVAPMIRIVLEHRTKDSADTMKLVQVIREIRAVAKQQPGFITGETLVNIEDPCHVLVISTWQKPEDWKAWDESPVRQEMRKPLLELIAEPYTVTTLSIPIVWSESIAHVF
jgi:heme oxygenase (mycobilin-producing)